MNPAVSVIVLTYNQEHCIARTLDSVLRQEVRGGLEVVIGDDASTDSTRAICEDYAGRYPGLIRLMPPAPNKGLVRNYYDCLAACRGRYITDCAGDDECIDGAHLQRMSDMLDADSRMVAVAADWVEHDMLSGSDNLVSASAPRSHAGLFTSEGKFSLFLSAVLYRRDVIVGDMERTPNLFVAPEFPCEDLPLFFALLTHGYFGHHPAPARRYNIGEGTVSRPKELQRIFRQTAAWLESLLALCGIYGVATDDVQPALDRKMDYMISLAFAMRSPDARSRIESLLRRNRYSLTAKSRLKLTIMRIPALWRVIKNAAYR